MGSLKKINKYRRTVMKGVTKNVGNSMILPKKPIDKNTIKRILICRPNHRLGNQLLLTPLVEELLHTLPHAKVDIFSKGGLSPILFETYPNVDQYILLPKKHFKQLFKYLKGWIALKRRSYDLVINVDGGSSSGRLSTKQARGKYKIFGDIDPKLEAQYPDYKHIAKKPVYHLRYFFEKSGITPSSGEIPPLSLRLQPDELSKAKALLDEIVPNDKKTICIFTNATGAKKHGKDWWNEFYDKLKANCSQYNIVEVLPVENISQIDFKAPSYYSKDIREISAFIANTELFVGTDSGMMHLAVTSGATTVGLFSVTKPEKYEPYGRKNTAVNTTTTSIDELVTLICSLL